MVEMTTMKPGWSHYPHPQNYKLWVDNASTKEGGDADFTVRINGKADHDIKVFYSTSDGTALGGKDYVPEHDFVVIKKGELSAGIDIRTIDDHKVEPTEHFNLKIWEFDKHVEVKDGHAIGTIYDNDKWKEPVVSVGDAKAKEGDAKGGVLSFDVHVDGPNEHGLIVRYHTEAGYGPYGANYMDKDYIPKGGDLYLKPGETHGTIDVQIIGDTKKEFDEHFKMVLDDTHYYKVGDGIGIGTIINDDKPPVTPSLVDGDAMLV